MKIDPRSAQQALLNARQAMGQGDHQAARRWARTAASLRPDLEEPWLFLAAVGSPRASVEYLERALRINPHSERARRGMQWAVDRLQKETEQLKSANIPPERLGVVGISQPILQPEPAHQEMVEEQLPAVVEPVAPHARPFLRAVQYLAGKALTIAATIFIGVFITVMLASQPSRRGLGPPVSPFETSLEAQIYLVVRNSFNNQIFPGVSDQNLADALTEKLRSEAGLNLPYLPRYLLWTLKALTFDWGPLGERQSASWFSLNRTTANARDIILNYLPNTILLMAAAYLLVFLIGMPLSLYLSRNYGKRADRILAILAPVSSVPSWVFGILLITIFAFQLHWLPFSGMYDTPKPGNSLGYLLSLSKHMILPVSAIVLSLLFQVIYAWRTFFIIYSEEDYVELAQAKGLPSRMLERKYILRPALPYVITSFATTLIGFWQLSMALEVIFRWPGLGWLYIQEALPNFWGESMEPGELIIAVGIVVIFAYLLGCVAFILDLVYVIIDPRIRLLPANNELQARARIKTWNAKLNGSI